MARFKNHLLVVLGFAIAGMIGAAFGTGTAQAVVSTLVTAVNTSTNPVQTNSVNVTDPGRIAYQSTIDNAGKCLAETGCNFIFPFVPTGHRVVIQHISGTVFFTGTPPAPGTILTVSGGGINSGFFLPVQGLDLIYFDQSVLFYVDSGNQLTVQIDAFTSLFSVSAPHQTVTLTGYELDCTVAACAPIATQ